ncbi:MAG: hypothetical protein GY703_16315 [Gammaproteobacteria bacterium]|nr:hypothetical protein [Gammaproteobacteria bacterium]
MRNPAIDTAHTAALVRWQEPFSGFASGQDPRTSDQTLRGLMYGGLEHAARYGWLNAGRRLIDKTYIDMLWHVQGLTNMRAVRPEQVSAALDGLIQETVRTVWHELAGLGNEEKVDLAACWVGLFAQQGFGTLYSKAAASRLLFFLLPMLQLFNLSRGHLMVLDKLGCPSSGDDYQSYAESAGRAYLDVYDSLRMLPRPTPVLSDSAQQQLIQQLLNDSDWWERRVFEQYLHCIADDAGIEKRLFACAEDGNSHFLVVKFP